MWSSLLGFPLAGVASNSNFAHMKKKVGILGATGYTGVELLRKIASHPEMEVVFVTSGKQVGKSLWELFPSLRGVGTNLSFIANEDALQIPVDGVFSCLHHAQAAAEIVPWLENTKSVIVDLSADFRMRDASIYQKYYGSHPRPDLLPGALYGIPEWDFSAPGKYRIIGNPGCYPTSVLLPLRPLLMAGLISHENIIVDSKSGVSGAGKTPTETTHFCEVHENFSAYKPADEHRHLSEINEQLSIATKKSVQVCFTPHLVPMSRGILSTIYCSTTKPIEHGEALNCLKSAYGKSRFVDILEKGLPQTAWVHGTNKCIVGIKAVPSQNRLVIISVIDNLVKGASGQALQNMNLALGLQEDGGLAV